MNRQAIRLSFISFVGRTCLIELAFKIGDLESCWPTCVQLAKEALDFQIHFVA